MKINIMQKIIREGRAAGGMYRETADYISECLENSDPMWQHLAFQKATQLRRDLKSFKGA